MRVAQAGIIKSLGIQLIDGEDNPSTHAQLIHIARKLVKSELQVIGFWPTGPDVAVPPVAIQLGTAILDLTNSTVAYIDANVRFPAMALASSRAQDDDSYFTTRWLQDSLALVVPKEVGAAGAGVPLLKAMVMGNRDSFAIMLVDLTGFDYIGDHLNAIELVDGVVMLAAVGKTREGHLMRLQQQIPEDKNLGVVLVG